MANTYYDGTKLLSLKDINGRKPEIYICTANRTAGKTTYFGRLCVNKWKADASKFCLIYRYNYELDNVADKFFKDIGALFFPDMFMRSERRGNGVYHELFIGYNSDPDMTGKPCGYALSLNNADQIKKASHFFSDVSRMLFDEFQSETNHYCNEEITKFISVHKSVARGQGEKSRYVPVYMLSNTVTVINPYYVEMGISTRIRADTKFLRGDGYVLEQGYVPTDEGSIGSGFDRAFSGNKYMAYANESVYLNDSQAFIEKPQGNSRYICTLKFKGKEYAIREYPEAGIIFCDDKPDKTFKNKIAVTTEDHGVNYVTLKANEFFLNTMKYYFNHGCFRFKDLSCKEAVFTALSY